MIADGDADLLAERLRALFVSTYGRWQCAQGTAHVPEAWFRILYEALSAECDSPEGMLPLARPFLVQRLEARTPQASEALQDEMATRVIERLRDTVTVSHLATPEAANAHLRLLRHTFRDEWGIRGQRVMFPIRAALTGAMVGPCLGITTSLLGPERCRTRADQALGEIHQARCTFLRSANL